MKKIQARRVFVPLDFSALSLKALPLARQLAAKGARITLFHAVEPVMTVAYAYGPESAVPVYDPGLTRKRVQKEAVLLQGMARGIRGAKALVMEARQAAGAIVAQARKARADLLVLSTHGRSGLSKLLYGSVAQRVLAHWKGEVVLLRPAGKS